MPEEPRSRSTGRSWSPWAKGPSAHRGFTPQGFRWFRGRRPNAGPLAQSGPLALTQFGQPAPPLQPRHDQQLAAAAIFHLGHPPAARISRNNRAPTITKKPPPPTSASRPAREKMRCRKESNTAEIATTWEMVLVFQIAGCDRIAFGRRDAAQTRNREFPADDQHHHPCRNGADLHQRNQGRGHQQLVGDRVEQRTDGSDLAPAAGQIPSSRSVTAATRKIARASQSLVSTIPRNQIFTSCWTRAATSKGTKKMREMVRKFGMFIFQCGKWPFCQGRCAISASKSAWSVDMPVSSSIH